MEKHAELRHRLNGLIDALIAEGRYETGEDAVRAIAELLEAREKKLAELRAAIAEGENSGPWEEFDVEEFLAEMHQKRADEKRKKLLSNEPVRPSSERANRSSGSLDFSLAGWTA